MRFLRGNPFRSNAFYLGLARDLQAEGF